MRIRAGVKGRATGNRAETPRVNHVKQHKRGEEERAGKVEWVKSSVRVMSDERMAAKVTF